MKKAIWMLMALFTTASVMAGMNDLLLVYSTKGVDRYEDGTAVCDGECYALVYTRAGYTFAGFNADGTALDPAGSDVALVAPVAKGGRCPPTLFQVNGDYADLRKNGAWEVFLIDTRDAGGTPTGLDAEGRVVRINAWRRVKGKIRVKKSDNAFAEVEQAECADALAGGASAVPPTAPRPRITGIRVVDGQVELTVADTVPYLTYDVEGAHEPRGFAHGRRRTRRIGRPQDGRANATIKMRVDANAETADGTARFYKIVRQ